MCHDVNGGQGRCQPFVPRGLPKTRRIPKGGWLTRAEFFARVGKFPQVNELVNLRDGVSWALSTSERASGGHRLCSGIGGLTTEVFHERR
jgi:hypothetical protein